MELAYDFHIHTAASPCGDELMSPNNIVNMALLKGLDAIAITDHNTCINVKAVMEVAKDTPLVVIPGMEIETSEEFHMVVLLPDLKQAMEMQEIVYNSLPEVKNRKDIFGDQIIYNNQDEIIGEIERLLLTATSLSVYDVIKIVKKLGGVSYPAHIDRNSYSIISNLGFIPPDLEINNIEISKHVSLDDFQEKYPLIRIIQSSDAHYLQDISERKNYMNLQDNSLNIWIELLKTP